MTRTRNLPTRVVGRLPRVEVCSRVDTAFNASGRGRARARYRLGGCLFRRLKARVREAHGWAVSTSLPRERDAMRCALRLGAAADDRGLNIGLGYGRDGSVVGRGS